MYEPFYRDEPHPERSLWFWYYNTSKRGVTLDLGVPGDQERLAQLVTSADLFIESEAPGRLPALGLDYENLRARNPRLVMLSITPYGQRGGDVAATDLTLMADGGPVWNCGYDDHSLPPVRGGSDQAQHLAACFAVTAAMTALLHRQVSGEGQYIDVNVYAAINVSTEGASYQWLVAKETVQRQAGRHASAHHTMPTQFLCKDGRYVATGTPPRLRRQFRQMITWLEELNLAEQFPMLEVLKDAAVGEPITLFQQDDPVAQMKMQAGRDAFALICQNLTAYEVFIQGQEYGNTPAIIYSPEEALEDRHILARGFPMQVEHPELGAAFAYTGAPWKFGATPWSVRRRAPLIGEDNAAVFGA
jgi:benzylsuccinate CoA-transferase BbsE subunit